MARAKKEKPPTDAAPGPVNPTTVDDLALVERIVLGSAPPVAIGSALQGMSHAASLLMLNATQAYQFWCTSMQAIATQAASEIFEAAQASPSAPAKASASPPRSKRSPATGSKKGTT